VIAPGHLRLCAPAIQVFEWNTFARPRPLPRPVVVVLGASLSLRRPCPIPPVRQVARASVLCREKCLLAKYGKPSARQRSSEWSRAPASTSFFGSREAGRPAQHLFFRPLARCRLYAVPAARQATALEPHDKPGLNFPSRRASATVCRMTSRARALSHQSWYPNVRVPCSSTVSPSSSALFANFSA